ncbi:hypothetical protein CHU_3059 [Cytophaga hutchinsonii ATCC 33406]|uniref:Uncharacterized protein n=1 Tax=Cytophaga hutchinsonii (strain ATCC 33406 / DSM 1761 / CIP 103989 / NBRC 15051 / NCIMB 9469 / D465) TaxID=269798 RepID=A0A6N4SV63_CYTH3|nr:hypothetical protein CHU_3059 [Cytophaga hutchinsonii ATCC 33406]
MDTFCFLQKEALNIQKNENTVYEIPCKIALNVIIEPFLDFTHNIYKHVSAFDSIIKELLFDFSI